MTVVKDASSPAAKTLTTTGVNTTASFSPPTGATLTVVVNTGNSAGALAQSGTLTDSLGGTWVQDKTANTTGQGTTQIFERTTKLTGAAMTVTWTPSGTNGKGSQITVYALLNVAGSPVGASVSSVNLSSAFMSFTAQKIGSYVIIGLTYTNSGLALVDQASTTHDLNTNDATNGETYASAHLTVNTLSAQNIGWTNTGLGAVGQFVAVEYLPGPVGKVVGILQATNRAGTY